MGPCDRAAVFRERVRESERERLCVSVCVFCGFCACVNVVLSVFIVCVGWHSVEE